ncbi:MAG: J domain-containing protein [Actinomycetota bacterium]|nr:J domain-containing protein [Actinomycetota bacterium]
MRTHYDLLGVSPHATQDEIRRAYHRLARRHHPDANPGIQADHSSRRTMAEINAAWAVLGNPEKRRAYDQAIGTAPRIRSAPGPSGVDHDDGGGYEDLRHLYDDLVVPRRARPSDMLIMIPVVLAVTAIALFAFSLMSESEGMRTTALFMVPVTAASFVAAPLVTMLKARSRDR